MLLQLSSAAGLKVLTSKRAKEGGCESLLVGREHGVYRVLPGSDLNKDGSATVPHLACADC